METEPYLETQIDEEEQLERNDVVMDAPPLTQRAIQNQTIVFDYKP